MALRKETTKRQFAEALASMLEPGERVDAASLTKTGPSPWLAQGLIGILMFYVLGARIYYLVVTDRRVVFMQGSFWSGRPKGLGHADARASVSVSDVRRRRIWSRLQYRRPDGTSLRLNFHRIWAREMDGVVQALTAPSIPPPPAPVAT
jgi:hypothetical protein